MDYKINESVLVRADSRQPTAHSRGTPHTVISSVTLIEQRVSSSCGYTKSTRPLKGEQILSVQKECVYLWSRTRL